MNLTPIPARLKFLVDEDLNLEWNKKTWGRDEDLWRSTYKYGYYWPGGSNQKNNIVTLIAENFEIFAGPDSQIVRFVGSTKY